MAKSNALEKEPIETINETDSDISAADSETLLTLQEGIFKGKEVSSSQEAASEVEKEVPSSPGKDKEDLTKKLLEGAKELEGKRKKEKEEPLSVTAQDFPFDDVSASKTKTKAEAETVEESVVEPEVNLNKETNLKNLRQLAGNFRRERDELSTKISQLEQQLKTRPTEGMVVAENNRLKARVQELEKWELVYNLENSPVYKQQFIEPLNGIIAEAKQIALDYGVGEEVASEVLYAGNRKELDEILEDNFSSQSARSDLKTLKQRFDGIQQKRGEFAKKPGEALTQFEEVKARTEAQKREQRTLHVKQIMQDGWMGALNQNQALPREQKIWELVEVPGKKEHNENVVRPALAEAGKYLNTAMSYVETLAAKQSLPSKEFVQWLAALCQQAAANQMINKSRWDYYNALQKQGKTTERTERIKHPEVSSSGRVGAVKAPAEKKSGRDRAADIFSEIVEDFTP